MKEKIARGLIPHEHQLLGSRHGKFFVRGLNLYLLKRDPEKWKTQQMQSGRGSSTSKPEPKKAEIKEVKPPVVAPPPSESKGKGQKQKRKRKTEPHDEIDELFESALGKRRKNVSVDTESKTDAPQTETRVQSDKSKKDLSDDKELNAIFTAIKNAPRELKSGAKRKK